MMKFLKSTAISLSLACQLIVGASAIVLVAPSMPTYATPCKPTGGSFLGLPAWYKYLGGVLEDSGRCSPTFSGADTEEQVNSALPIGLAILEGMLRISGVVAVVMIFWSAFKFITTQGAPDAASSARKTAINALIGLVIVIFATTLVSFVGNSLLPS
jgi:hypothetical protein